MNLFEIRLGDDECFSELNKAYYLGVLDPQWARTIYGIERAHWLFLARLLTLDKFGANLVDPCTSKLATQEIELPPVKVEKRVTLHEEMSLKRICAIFSTV